MGAVRFASAEEVCGAAGRGLARTLGTALLALLLTGALPEAAPHEDPAAGLRAGLAARDAGRPADAARHFAAVAAQHPAIADHAERLRIEALVEAGALDEAITAARSHLERFPDALVRDRVERALGHALIRRGASGAGREALAAALARARDDETRAALRLARGASFEAEGLSHDAAAEYLRIWRDLPSARVEPEAAAGLDRLEVLAGVPPRDAAAWAARSRALYDALANEKALAATKTALGLSLPPAERLALRRQRAFLLFRLRRYAEAEAAFAALEDGEARLFHARALARSGRISESVTAFEALAASPVPEGVQARFLAATLLEGEGETERAAAHFTAVAERAATAELRGAARWRLGWAAYLAGQREEALGHFARLATEAPDPIDRLRARYWRGRALAAGRAEEAAREYRALAHEAPFSYYGWRAAERLADAPPLAPPPPPALAALAAALPETSRMRIRILVDAGLLEEAAAETDRLARGRRGREDRLALAALYTEADQFHAAQRLALSAARDGLHVAPDPMRPEPWWFAWPHAFADLVEAAVEAAGGGASAALVWAVMREESAYRPDAVSTVGARGLTQIMPATGARLASQRGWPEFDAEVLFDPARNVELGAFYLSQLLARFEGRVSAAVAAYNAGSEPVARWLAERGDLADDEWVETIPYDQTHRYVKRVLRSLHAYQLLYGAASGLRQ
jgi:soluble lytic murein transglycosylase